MNEPPAIEQIIQQIVLGLDEVQCLDQCVSGTAILIEVLQQLGYPRTHPVSLGVKIWSLNNPTAGIMLGKGTSPKPGKWPGHLAAVVLDYCSRGHLLIDLTIVQINAIHQDICVNPVLGYVDDAFLNGQESFYFQADGCQFVYDASPADDTYLADTNWTRIPRLEEAVALVLSRLA